MSYSYCTRADFERAFGQDETARLADRDQVGDETALAIETQLERATADVDMSLRSAGYATPVASPTEQIKGWVLDIARFYLFDQGELADDSAKVRRYKAATETLKQIAARRLTLDLPVATAPLANSDSDVSFVAPARTFSRDTLGDF